jgi:hypothetical protein
MECSMAAPAKKRSVEGSGKVRTQKDRNAAAELEDADLQAFRAMSRVSRRATAKELDRLIRPAE